MGFLAFPLIDSHLHQWDPRTTPREGTPLVKALGRFPVALKAAARLVVPKATRDFLGRLDYVGDSYLPADYDSDIASNAVEAVVHVQAGWRDSSPFGSVGETRWIAQLPFRDGAPRLGAVVAEADPGAHNFDALLAAHQRASPLVRGVRLLAACHGDRGVHAWARDDQCYLQRDFLAGFERLAARGLRFDAWVYSTQLQQVTEVARRNPDVPIVIDHLGTPVGVFGPSGKDTGRTPQARHAILEAWKDDLAALAEQPNVFAKASGLLMPVLGHDFHQRGAPPASEEIANRLAPLLHHALDVFEPQRVMFGSNFPIDKVSAPLSFIISAVAAVVAERGDAALRAVFRDTATRFYDL
jgi:L-fuconolactonase